MNDNAIGACTLCGNTMSEERSDGRCHMSCWNEWRRRRDAGACTACGRKEATMGNWCDGCGANGSPDHLGYAAGGR